MAFRVGSAGEPIGRTPAQDDAPAPKGVDRLGEGLAARTGHVAAVIERRAAERSIDLAPVVASDLGEMSLVCTRAFARWLSGARSDVARDAGRDAWRILGQLAATQEASLSDVIKFQLLWRDSVEDVLVEEAARLGSSNEALSTTLLMLQRSLDVTLVRMGGSFEAERKRAHNELARREDELTFLATHDPLTGLPNRTLMLDRLDQMLARATRNRTSAAAVFIDLDNFKAINDSLGHKVGDELLCAFAARLAAVVRESDALGRLGGDEFVVAAEDLTMLAGPELLAERLLEVLKQPFVLNDREDMPLKVSASIGIATASQGSAESLLHDADVAMYRAKRDGKNRYTLFESGMQVDAQSNLELEMDLHVAVQEQQFCLVYQPIFDLRESRTKGMEALLRWNHPTRGLVSPMDFIPTLEKSNLICVVGRWVIDEACRQAAEWEMFGTSTGISVNVSAKQLESDELVTHVREALDDSGLEPGTLTIEVTETALMMDPDAAAQRLSDIADLGVRIAIDDFGTGYSSLAHLQKFPIDLLKIDRSFVVQMARNPEGETLIETLVQLGKSLSIETLAEGIEQSVQLERLIEHDCDSGQGFLFARPLDADAATSFLRGSVAHAS